MPPTTEPNSQTVVEHNDEVSNQNNFWQLIFPSLMHTLILAGLIRRFLLTSSQCSAGYPKKAVKILIIFVLRLHKLFGDLQVDKGLPTYRTNLHGLWFTSCEMASKQISTTVDSNDYPE